MQHFYIVRPGDTLYLVASRWGLSLESLIAANNLSEPYTIYPGQQLSVPPAVNTVRVAAGDSVFSIAQRYGILLQTIIQANQLQPPYSIQVGQLLKVPSGNPFYIVQSTDTLIKIAERYNVITEGLPRPFLIQQINRLPSTTIIPGMRLVIPYAPPGGLRVIAYTAQLDNIFGIWIYNPALGETRLVTKELVDSNSIPFWSPDGKKLAYVGRDGVVVIFDFNSHKTARIDQLQNAFHLGWSPDSTRLAYSKDTRIIIYNIMSHTASAINQPNASNVQWFPDGTKLLFEAPDVMGISQLYQISIDGRDKKQLTRNLSGRFNFVNLSPDGKSILYTSPGVSISLIYVLDLPSGKIYELPSGPLAKNYYPKWAPNSSDIAYSSTTYFDSGYYSQIRLSDKVGKSERILALSSCFSTPVTWSPNGRQIAYLSGCTDESLAGEMWIIDINHPVPIRVLKDVRISNLQWSP